MNAYQNHSLDSFSLRNLFVTDVRYLCWNPSREHCQNEQIELIASENIVSKAVMQAQGTCLTNKY